MVKAANKFGEQHGELCHTQTAAEAAAHTRMSLPRSKIAIVMHWIQRRREDSQRISTHTKTCNVNRLFLYPACSQPSSPSCRQEDWAVQLHFLQKSWRSFHSSRTSCHRSGRSDEGDGC